jgi:hypothetical protein
VTGAKSVLASGLAGPASADRAGSDLLVLTGGSDAPDADLSGTAKLFAIGKDGSQRLVADFLAYELAHNPDGQTQFVDGQSVDSLSNPFNVLAGRGSVYAFVADAGGNTVYAVPRRGEPRPFFVPPVVTDGVCAGAPNNDPQHAGCDPVPTGLAYGPGNTLYVSTLGAEAPGAGKVYVLDLATGAVRRVISGLTAPTGLAVAPDGTVYVSEVLHGAPEGDPGPGFDPSTVGQITRIAPNGTRTIAQVTMPVGLDFHGGTLYSSAWSVGYFLGIEGAGEVVKVAPSAFS